MNLLTKEPNFSIVLPGCNANCKFCFANDKVKGSFAKDYLTKLDDVLSKLPKEFYQISITGGEPTINKMFGEVLKVIKRHRTKFSKVVLTTNGTKLLDNKKYIEDVVDHINLSVHHYNDGINASIFGGSYDLDSTDFEKIVDEFGSIGIDVSVNCVIDDNTSEHFAIKFIDNAKQIGFNSVRFRKVNGDNEPVKVEQFFSNYKVVWTGSCPVCVSRKRIIKGIDVYWKTSVVEPNDKSDGKIFELIYLSDGNVYSDWLGKNIVKINSSTKAEEKKSTFFDKPVTGKKEIFFNTEYMLNSAGLDFSLRTPKMLKENVNYLEATSCGHSRSSECRSHYSCGGGGCGSSYSSYSSCGGGGCGR